MMTKKKPIIGYTARNGIPNFLNILISINIRIAGGKPLRLRPNKPFYNKGIDGLIISGGTDLYPARFKADPKPDYIYDEARDEMEIQWLSKAEKADIPTLGICRGAQLMNVSRGGSLHIDISKIYERAEYPSGLLANIFYRKPIKVVEISNLYSILKTNITRVNSMHKQAINILGDNLKISAREKNGVIQGIEDPDKDFFIGVQFHPEALILKDRFRNIFKKLVNASSKH